MGSKIRDAFWVHKLPILVVVGDKDVEQDGATLSLRETPKEQKLMALPELVSFLQEHCAVPDVK